MNTVFLVRHAEPVATADSDPAAWPLSESGLRRAAALRSVLPADARWVASTERKAVETLEAARSDTSRQVERDRRLGEVVRPGEPFDAEVVGRRRAWVERRPDDRHDGWETMDDAARRLDSALGELTRSHPVVVAGSHGMLITAWLVRTGIVGAGADAGRFWADLSMPEVLVVDLSSGHPWVAGSARLRPR